MAIVIGSTVRPAVDRRLNLIDWIIATQHGVRRFDEAVQGTLFIDRERSNVFRLIDGRADRLPIYLWSAVWPRPADESV